MASYAELEDLGRDKDLLVQVVAACEIAAEGIRTDVSPPSNQAQRMAWAVSVFKDPDKSGNEMLRQILAANKDATVSQIKASTDAVIQAAVDTAVDFFAGS